MPRIKKPSAIEKAEGMPGHRPLNKREPKPVPGEPQCPSHLDEGAKAEWRRLVPILLRMNVLSEADGMELAALCQTYSTMVRAQQELSKTGLLYKRPNGSVVQSPLLRVVTEGVATINRLAQQFGLTPSSRARVSIISNEPADDFGSRELAKVLMMPRRSRE